MKSIVESLNLLPSTATRQVDLLVNQELIKRNVAKTDRRKVILSLTEKGRKLNRRFKNHLNLVLNNTLKSHSKEEIMLAVDVLHTIVVNSENNLPLK